MPRVLTGLADIMLKKKDPNQDPKEKAKKENKRGGDWRPKDPYQYWDMTEEIKKYPLVTAKMLAKRRVRPRRCKMLVRDFIDG